MHDLIPTVAEAAAAIRSKYSQNGTRKLAAAMVSAKRQERMLRAIKEGALF
jgi:Holliday junction resolvase-like predicted endonuclease